MNLGTIIGDSAPAVAIVSGLTQVIKTATNLKDNLALALTVGVGVVVTGGMDYALLTPATAQDWVIVGLHGVVVGLSAAGLYKVGIAMAAKANPNTPVAPPGDMRNLADPSQPAAPKG